jgi:hypothetical protein
LLCFLQISVTSIYSQLTSSRMNNFALSS